MKFLLIDDSSFDLFTQEKLLLRSGLTTEVITFSSAQLALDFLETQPAEMPETVILLDLQMPGINGFQFIAKYAHLADELRARIKVFMISSTVDRTDMEEATANPFIIQLLSKPLEIPVLKSLLNM
ncbi:response regulator [Dyadobacter sediminis]|uniref:Response regulator n=1 Tax=Dyadobacter sediminis TaxID=1493691 RepID=A0A5R9KFH3_9BACT|nr:response regulator [Dyadobacter sediminis]TLU94873.1 response regulator [Dyadobacter sediminis]GGB87224.1 response regulator [Dyadobacter sediminis]